LDQLAAERKLPEEIVAPIRAYQQERVTRVAHRSDGDDGHKKLMELRDDVEIELIATERKVINDLYRSGKLKDEARRRIERELDLREARLASVRAEE
ncbi:MAG TPA: Na+/H+ antiporter, partial [Methylovirgula sp.]|nr:Na+/H+ antiporter [Methylovirgula sp.]